MGYLGIKNAFKNNAKIGYSPFYLNSTSKWKLLLKQAFDSVA